SRHELVFAFKKGEAPHVNTFELGQHGRYRTNVWNYRGVNTMRAGRMEELALHPTVKPVQMIADAIRDVSGRGEIVLDLFGGSGSTLIAAEKTGRRGHPPAGRDRTDPLQVPPRAAEPRPGCGGPCGPSGRPPRHRPRACTLGHPGPVASTRVLT